MSSNGLLDIQPFATSPPTDALTQSALPQRMKFDLALSAETALARSVALAKSSSELGNDTTATKQALSASAQLVARTATVGSRAMPAFKCLLIGQSDKVVQHETIEAANSVEALARMEHMLLHRASLTAVEVWDNGSLAMRLTQGDLHAADTPARNRSTAD